MMVDALMNNLEIASFNLMELGKCKGVESCLCCRIVNVVAPRRAC